jgi:hypothetical protein
MYPINIKEVDKMNRPEAISRLTKRIRRMQTRLMQDRPAALNAPNVIEHPIAYKHQLMQINKAGRDSYNE